LHRRASAWFGASFLLACIGSLGTGELVREHLRTGQSFWLISRTIYLIRDQYLRSAFSFLSPTLTLALWPIFAIVVVALIRKVRLGAHGFSALPEIVAGLFMGGSLANVLEAQVIGSVTDFLGIRGFGIYSAGDIAIDVASSMLPMAVIQIARAQHQTHSHVMQAGAASYVAVVLLAVAAQDFALAALVTLVTGAGATLPLTKRVISPQKPSR
jgi:lipoprotein signal peptidase